MSPKNLNGNQTKHNPSEKVEPTFKTLPLTSNEESHEHSVDPVNPTTEMDAIAAKKAVDENQL